MLTHKDRQQLRARHIGDHMIERQLTIFRQGIPFVTLVKPCILGDGIFALTPSDREKYEHVFEEAMSAGRVSKFVPASGAASRMFKSLSAFWHDLESVNEQAPSEKILSKDKEKDVLTFFNRLQSFAFYDEVRTHLSQKGFKVEVLRDTKTFQHILHALLTPDGLNYANLPKALLPFHRYPDYSRTPFEEHLVEAMAYAKDAAGRAQIHFTVSPGHDKLMHRHLAAILRGPNIANGSWDVTFSHQKPSTDTIAVDLKNRPFRDSSGALVFRPGGHGALLDNLQDLQGDIVFIKNIDNVVPDYLKTTTYLYKKALGGYLVSAQQTLFSFLHALSSSQVTGDNLSEMAGFMEHTLSSPAPMGFSHWSNEEQISFLFDRFNRPLRVCGMVKNLGDPGGGPFWVKDTNGDLSLQIVEASQVDRSSPEQQAILNASTHFNPVDLVCGVRDFQGNPFDLFQYRNDETSFISRKSYEGQELKALELPGLWNGGMAQWNTIFIEVPSITFNPVKTVLDLLRPEHQPA